MPPLEAQAALFALRVKLREIKLNFEVGSLPAHVSRPGNLVGEHGLGAAPILSRAKTGGNAALQSVLNVAQRFLGKHDRGHVELLEAVNQGLLQTEDIKRPVRSLRPMTGGAAMRPLPVSRAKTGHASSERFARNFRVEARPFLQGRAPEGFLELSPKIFSLRVR